MSEPRRIGVYDYLSLSNLLFVTVLRLNPKYRGPRDAQALIQYLEAMVLEGRRSTIAETGAIGDRVQ